MGWEMTIPHLAFQDGSRIRLELLAPRFWVGIMGNYKTMGNPRIPANPRDTGPELPLCFPGEHSGNSRFPLAQLDPGGKGAGTNIPIKPKFPIPARAKQKQLLPLAPQILWDNNKTSGKLE